MKHKLLPTLLFAAFSGALLILPPNPAAAQASCRDAAILWWDLGWAPFASPFGYLAAPVDPFSAEWSSWDCGCGWYGYDGYGGYYYPRWDWRGYGQVRGIRRPDFILAFPRPLVPVAKSRHDGMSRSRTPGTAATKARPKHPGGHASRPTSPGGSPGSYGGSSFPGSASHYSNPGGGNSSGGNRRSR